MSNEVKHRIRNSSVLEQLEDKMAELEHTVSDTVQKLFHFDDMEHWVQDNPFIVHGYRICKTYADSWKSMLYWHNETMNIWTHLLSMFLFIGMIFNIWMNWEEPLMDKVMFTIYCACAIKCFSASSLYHLHCHQSYETYRIFSCLDFAGISFMIMGSCMLLIYYVYYCDPFLQSIWLTVAVAVSFVGILGPFVSSRFAKYPSLRTVSYILCAGLSGLPVGIHIFTHSVPFSASGFFFFLGMIACYIFGALIYVQQVPERYSPGSFDILFHSHQIWHLFVTSAAILFYWCAIDMMNWREANQCI